MSLKIRLTVLSGALLLVFLGALLALRTLERRQAAESGREASRQDEILVRQWLQLADQPVLRFTEDYAQWPALRAWLDQPDAGWADAQVRASLGNYDAQAVWILDAQGRTLYTARPDPGPVQALPDGLLDWIRAPQPKDTVFTESRDGLLQLWSAPIGPDAHGFFVVARSWSDRYVAALSRLSEARVRLAPAEPPGAARSGEHEIDVPLRDVAGRTLRHLLVRMPEPAFVPGPASDLHTTYLLVAFGAALVASLWLALRRWVLQPLGRIGESLSTGNLTPIGPLLQGHDELGRIARLVETSAQQRTELQATIAEQRRTEEALRDSEAALRHSLDLRTRLARDLHDGVIQSIYAAGLGLESAIAQFPRDPAGAQTRLQLCRQSLNEVIREVRGFIGGIEPESVHNRGFAQQLAALAHTMQALWPVVIRTEVDEATASRLSPTQELHALQISRECLSNAVRHGGARSVRIHLGAQDGTGFLEVEDDGSGFDVATARGTGSGLLNLEARARELGGTLQVDSAPLRSTIVRITFPLSPVP